MPIVPEHFRIDVAPTASREAVVRVDNARFTILTDRLIRLEFDPSGCFEDRATQTIWFRQQPVPDFALTPVEGGISIETDALSLRYADPEGIGFTPDTLSIRVKSVDVLWYPGDVDASNLKGTTRTLDVVNGYTPLGSGLMSRFGWSLLDDSRTLVLDESGWIEVREGQSIDWYFFGYGHDYKACLRDYCAVSGQIPMIPRWILGNWWSRYWAYTQDELSQLLDDFQAQQIPLSVCIVDMDWHLTETGNQSTGWTGYTWNRKLFPNPEGFITFLHQKGLRTALNLHPAEGIHPHEERYPEMARRLGIDPASGQPVEFDITNPEFVKAYFELLHHPYEEMGVDFWWLDWQQGLKCRIEGLDPLWLINHLHFHDLGRKSERRPFIFSRWGNEGHQRYPIGFSGDSYRTWETLRFEPYMTAAASNIAYGWWSHDIGGHTSGTGDGELFTRWVQFGVFSPIMRIHSTKGEFYDQRPWMFESTNVQDVLRDTLQLRHALIPYLYTMAWRGHRESLPLMLPMYYDYPECEAAYHCPQQYQFGSELIAAPYVEPADAGVGLSRQVVWLPEGEWTHFFTGEHFAGDRWHAVYGSLRDIPLFAKAGAIVPLAPKVGWGGIGNPSELHVHVFAGADHVFTLYEDDGDTRGYLDGASCLTTFSQRWGGNRLDFTMDAVEGDRGLIPVQRTIHVYVHGVKEAVRVTVAVDGAPLAVGSSYDAETETLGIDGINVASTLGLQVMLESDGTSMLSRRDRKRETVLRLLRAFRLNTGVRNRLAEKLDAVLADPEQVSQFLLPMSPLQSRALLETLYEAGIQHIPDTDQPTRLIIWNNREDAAITYRYADVYLFFGMLHSAHAEQDVAPRFAAFTPKIESWHDGALGENVHRTQWHLQMDYHNIGTVSESYREVTP